MLKQNNNFSMIQIKSKSDRIYQKDTQFCSEKILHVFKSNRFSKRNY